MAKSPRKARSVDILPFPTISRQMDIGAETGNDHLLLRTVLNSMSQGVVVFDAETRLDFRNQRYLDMYRLPAETAQPGCTLRDLLNHRVAARTFSGDRDQYVVGLLEGIREAETSYLTMKLADGRAFSIVNKQMPGGGWLATHEDITERQRAEERIAHMAGHDALTDLPNRILLRERLEYELKRVKRGECLAVLCLDLDHFKSVNDTLGHPIGDELLKVVADRLRGCTREPDTIARLGGDRSTGIKSSSTSASESPLRRWMRPSRISS
jgi:hypothetical protein